MDHSKSSLCPKWQYTQDALPVHDPPAYSQANILQTFQKCQEMFSVVRFIAVDNCMVAGGCTLRHVAPALL